MSKRTESAASLLRQAVKMCEDDVADRALRLAKQAVRLLEAGGDDEHDEDGADDNHFPLLGGKAAAVSTLTRATRSADPELRRDAQALLERVDPKRAEQRRIMGLSASTARPVSVNGNRFVFAVHALAESKARRMRP